MLDITVRKIFSMLTTLTAKLRGKFWKLFLHSMGENVCIMKGVLIANPRTVSIGHNVLIGPNTSIIGGGKIVIGDYVMIAKNCSIISSTHKYTAWEMPMYKQGDVMGEITIGDDVWIGVNVVIMPHVHVGKGSVIGANAVVTHDVMPFSIVGGIPARFIKYRFHENVRKSLLNKKYE